MIDDLYNTIGGQADGLGSDRVLLSQSFGGRNPTPLF
jgi:hypothetical protein